MKLEIKGHQKKISNQLARFGDIRFTGQIIFVAIVLLITWSGIRAIQSNYNLQQQIGELKQQNQLIKLQNSTIALQNNYYQSNQYLELSARQNFGLALPNEKELLVPESIALSYTRTPPDFTATLTTSQNSKNQLNYETWIRFFLDRNPST